VNSSVHPAQQHSLDSVAMPTSYNIPASTTTIEHVVARSRFIATVMFADSVEVARALLAERRVAMSDASHHVYAFRIGHGASVIDGLSDDGEPTGTAGPPIMNVLRGSDLGDALIIVTRYFGGTKLGTGGLVRAYSEAAALVLKECPITLKVFKGRLAVLLPYASLTLLKRILPDYEAEMLSETYSDAAEFTLELPLSRIDALTAALTEMTSGAAIIEPIP
jgi:uncharacterized YigZ family protein